MNSQLAYSNGEAAYIDVANKTIDIEMELNVKYMVEELADAIKDNANFKKILEMKLGGEEESEIVKNLNCSIVTGYKEVGHFKKLAVTL